MFSFKIKEKCGIHLFFLFISIILYFISPFKYSQPYCSFLLVLVIINALVLYIQDRKNEPLGFNVLFTASFLFTTYIYPVFIFPIFPNYSLFVYEINSDIITKATALSNVAYAAYSVGYTINLSRVNLIREKTFLQLVPIKQNNNIATIEVLLIALIVITGGLEFFNDTYSGESVNANPLFKFVYTLFFSFTIFFCIVDCTSKELKTKFIICVVIIVLLTTGTRTLPLSLMSIYLCYYSLQYKMNLKKIILATIVVFVAFTLVGHLRNDDSLSNMSGSQVAIFEAFRDFIVSNRNLYAIYDHVSNASITYGISSLSYILAPIPFLQSTISNLFGIPAYEMRSETLTTFWAIGENSPLGLGTHIVGDVYLSFGFIGVVVLFYYLGKIVCLSRTKGLNGIPDAMIIYYVLISGAIFMCRGSYFFSLKNLIWVLLLWYIFNHLKISKKKFIEYS